MEGVTAASGNDSSSYAFFCAAGSVLRVLRVGWWNLKTKKPGDKPGL
jgi:hypothetical protein